MATGVARAVTRRIFLSYSHEDGAWRDAFRQMLDPALERFGVELWADDHIRSGDRWERAIHDALAEVDLGVLLVTPAYLRSRFSWEVEIPALIAAEVPIVWVLVKACGWEHKTLLRERQGLQDPRRDGALADHRRRVKELDRICRKLCNEHLAPPAAAPRGPASGHGAPAGAIRPAGRIAPSRPGKVFGAVPAQPSAFVARSEEFERLRTHLVEGRSGAVGLAGTPSAFGVHGQGGIGKTVLASELARDPQTQAHFPDGVFWLTLGERPDLVGAQRQLATWLGGDAEEIRSALQGAKVLRDLAGPRQCLVVLDDVWSLGAAQAFAVTGEHGRVLLTTRDPRILEGQGAKMVALDVLSPSSARELLGRLAGVSDSALPHEADAILKATGRVALAVALLGAAIGRGHQDWATVAARLADVGEVFAGHPYADTFKALEVATAGLGDDQADRYQALACFRQDTVIPTVTIGRLWGLAEPDLSAELRRLAELKLVQLQGGGVVFHDLERDYLLLHAEAAALAHEQLLAAHQVGLGRDWHRLDPDDPYLWDHLTYHLAAAGRHHELIASVADPAWLAARIARDGTLAAESDLVEGLRWEPGEARLAELLRRVRQTSHHLDRAAAVDAVVATLATHLWVPQERIDLGRLDATGYGRRPAIAWIADATSPQLLRTVMGHTGVVRSVAWSPDGTRLASGADDGVVRLWDAVTGTELRALRHTRGWGWVRSVAWSPDGTRVASAADGGVVRLWDAVTGTELLALSGHTDGARSVAWSPDGTRLASERYDGRVRLWDAATGAELCTLTGRPGAVTWSPDGTRLASAVGETLRLWDAATGTELRTLSGHTGAVRSVAWSPDGTRLASAAADATLRLWDAGTGAELRAVAWRGGVLSLAWSPDGTRLASSRGGDNDDNTVRVWDAGTGAELRALVGHTSLVWSLAWSPDGTRLASGAGDITRVNAGFDGDATMRVWAAGTGTDRRTVAGHAGLVKSVAWSPDGTRLASGADDNTVRLWDAVTGGELRSLAGHSSAVQALAWSPDGTRLASGGGAGDSTVRVWDAVTGEHLRHMARLIFPVLSLAWSPDGTQLVASSHENTVRVWDAATGAELRALVGPSRGSTGRLRALKGRIHPVYSVAWSPDGTRLALGASDNTVRVWNPVGGKPRALARHNNRVGSVAWSADGTRLAAGDANGMVRLWDAFTGKKLAALAGHTRSVRSVAWSPDGTRVASGDLDGTVRLWDTATGRPEWHIVAGGTVSAVDFSKRSGALAVGADRAVIVYQP